MQVISKIIIDIFAGIIFLLYLCVVIKTRALIMIDDDELKAREDELIENLNYFLRHYNHLVNIGFRKPVLDSEIKLLTEELKKLKS
jgi:hypothetical protein